MIHAYRLAVLTGLRPGELRGLRWQDVKRDRLELHQSTNCYNEITDGKNQNARRCVECPTWPAWSWKHSAASRGR